MRSTTIEAPAGNFLYADDESASNYRNDMFSFRPICKTKATIRVQAWLSLKIPVIVSLILAPTGNNVFYVI